MPFRKNVAPRPEDRVPPRHPLVKGRPRSPVNDVVGFEARVPVRERPVIRGRPKTNERHLSQLERILLTTHSLA